MVTRLAADHELVVTAGGRLGRDTVIYGIAIGIALPFGLAGVAIFTRYLTPSEYGHLALLLVGCALLTVLYNAPTLMGTLSVAYGAGAEDDEAGSAEDKPGAVAGRSREALTTGVVLTLATIVPPTACLLALAPEVAAFIADPGLATAVMWAAVSAGAGSMLRLVLNVPRMERRPAVYTTLSTLRPALALAIGWWLVAMGHGPEGVLAGLAIGTAVAALITLLMTGPSYAPRPSVALVPLIAIRSWRHLPIIASTWTLQNVDLLLLSRYASEAAVGGYRVANRLAAFVLYGVSAFLMSMAPLQQSSLFKAAHATGGEMRVRGLLVRYFTIAGVYIVFVVALAADTMFLLAGPAYRHAATLVPLIAAGFVTFGLVRVCGWIAPVPHRGALAIRSMSVAAICFIPVCIVLIELAGDVGAASAMLLVTFGAAAWWAWRIGQADMRGEVGWPRVFVAVAVAVACYGMSAATTTAGAGWRVAIDVTVAVFLYPAALILSGAVPIRHLRPLTSIVSAAMPTPRRANHALKRRIDELDGFSLMQIRKALVISASGNADVLAHPSDLEQFVRALRQIGDIGDAGVHDGEIGTHLVRGGTYVELQARAESLRQRGVDAADLYRLEDVFQRASRLVRIA